MATLGDSARLRLERYEAVKLRRAERAERGRLKRERRAAATARYAAKRVLWAEMRAAREALPKPPRKPRDTPLDLACGRMPWPADYFETSVPLQGCALSTPRR